MLGMYFSTDKHSHNNDCEIKFQREVKISSTVMQVGHSFLERRENSNSNSIGNERLLLLHQNLAPLEALMKCVQMNWMAILVIFENTFYI